jgi:hypothetical protein
MRRSGRTLVFRAIALGPPAADKELSAHLTSPEILDQQALSRELQQALTRLL